MALPNIVLDDRSFDQLFAFMRKEIDVDVYTDHNYSDPGIVLLDLMCWIAESIIYRADRVPDGHVEKFANLILDPPEQVTVQLTLTATFAPSRTAPLIVKAGTRFATDFAPAADGAPARRIIFETIAPVTFQAPPPAVQSVLVTARECLGVKEQTLGLSNGAPNQLFPLRPVHAVIGLPPGVITPVLLDPAHTSDDYNPNPRVAVNGTPWQLKQSLRTEESWTAFHPDARHFMVDANAGAIRFGDGQFGLIPDLGAKIVCTYQVLQGPDALVPAGSVVNRLDVIAGFAAGEKIEVASGDAEGGGFFVSPELRLSEGLKRFRRPYRLITADDFEQVLRSDFNAYQDLATRAGTANRPEKILRTMVLMNHRPQARPQSSSGCVTLVVLVQKDLDLDRALTDPTLPVTAKQQLISLPEAFVAKLKRFLDKRRLITTRIFMQSPQLVPLSINVQVAIAGDRFIDDMTRIISDRIRAFFGVIAGGDDGKGWPLGGAVYRSKLFRLIEDIDGVDHVESLSLGAVETQGAVQLPGLALPALSSLVVGVERA